VQNNSINAELHVYLKKLAPTA